VCARFLPSRRKESANCTLKGGGVTPRAAMQIDYESLSGSKYVTAITWEGTMMLTQFHSSASR